MIIAETIPSRVEAIPDAISSIIERLFSLSLDAELIFDIKLALQEAVINAVKHGNQLNNALSVHIIIRTERHTVTIDVTDEGKGFDFKRVPNPTDDENLAKREGRGIFLIKHLMDKVQFLNGGRTIRMIKKLRERRRGKMQIRTEINNGITMVVCGGEINLSNSSELRNTFKEILQRKETKVVFDFKDVFFIDSSGLATLIEMDQELKKVKGQIRLANINNKKVRGIFEITRLDKLFKIYESREDALKDF